MAVDVDVSKERILLVQSINMYEYTHHRNKDIWGQSSTKMRTQNVFVKKLVFILICFSHYKLFQLSFLYMFVINILQKDFQVVRKDLKANCMFVLHCNS